MRKATIGITLLAFFLGSCRTPSEVQSGENLPRIDNIRIAQNADTVRVYYDLIARSENARFNVQLLLSLGENQNYEITSPAATGALGENIIPGQRRRIDWNVLEDFPGGLNGENFQFVIHAEEMRNSRKWFYISAGALLVGAAGTAAALLLGSEGSDGLPQPPGRPSGSN